VDEKTKNPQYTMGDIVRDIKGLFDLVEALRAKLPDHHRRQLGRLDDVNDALVLLALDYRLPITASSPLPTAE